MFFQRAFFLTCPLLPPSQASLSLHAQPPCFMLCYVQHVATACRRRRQAKAGSSHMQPMACQSKSVSTVSSFLCFCYRQQCCCQPASLLSLSSSHASLATTAHAMPAQPAGTAMRLPCCVCAARMFRERQRESEVACLLTVPQAHACRPCQAFSVCLHFQPKSERRDISVFPPAFFFFVSFPETVLGESYTYRWKLRSIGAL